MKTSSKLLKALTLGGSLPCILAAPTAINDPECGIGGDGTQFYSSTTVTGVEECMNTCNTDPKCLSSQFKPSTGICWLYDKPVSQAKTKEAPTTTYLFNDKGCATVKLPAGPRQCGVGGDGSEFYASSSVRNLRECMMGCERDAKCYASQFNPAETLCWLYSKPVSQVKTKDASLFVFNDKGCPITTAATTTTTTTATTTIMTTTTTITTTTAEANISQKPQCDVGGDGTSYFASLTTKTVGECQSACNADTKCLSSEFRPSSSGCWLYSDPVEKAKTREANATLYVFNDKACPIQLAPEKAQCGIGGDASDFFTTATAKTLAECQAACKSDANCFSSQYQPSNSGCWLYFKPASQAITKEADATNYVFHDKDCPIAAAATPEPTADNNKDMCGIGGDGSNYYTVLTVKTMSECQTTCKNDTRCKSSEYRPSTGACWLYSQPTSSAKIRDSAPSSYVFNDKNCPIRFCGVGGTGGNDFLAG